MEKCKLVNDSLNNFTNYLNCLNSPIRYYYGARSYGPSGEQFLSNILLNQNSKKRPLIPYLHIFPCLRQESKKNIIKGTHLSLFFLMAYVFSSIEQKNCVNTFVNHVLGCSEYIDLISVLSFMIDVDSEQAKIETKNYAFSKIKLLPAKGFPYVGSGIEIVSQNNLLELGTIYYIWRNESEYSKNNAKILIGFGVERLLMNYLKLNSIWEEKPFLNLLNEFNRYGDKAIIDHQRTLSFLNIKRRIPNEIESTLAMSFQ